MSDRKSHTTPRPTRSPCASPGCGGDYRIPASGLDPGYRWPWHISWLPKGYAVTEDDRVVCVVAPPHDEDWSDIEGRPPLVEAICEAIERYMIGRAK